MDMKKRGQFYIVAAIIIISVLLGIAALTNYIITKPQPAKLYDLGKELDLETGNVVAHGIYTDKATLDSLMENWANQYVNYAHQYGEIEWVFIYGNYNKVTVLVFSEQTIGTIDICVSGGECSTITLTGQEVRKDIQSPTGNQIEINAFDNKYDFQLNTGENFFFVLNKSQYKITS